MTVIQIRRQVPEILKQFDEGNFSQCGCLCILHIKDVPIYFQFVLVFDKNKSYFSGGGAISPGPEGEILHRQENHQKQEEAGKGDESPQGTAAVTAAVS